MAPFARRAELTVGCENGRELPEDTDLQQWRGKELAACEEQLFKAVSMYELKWFKTSNHKEKEKKKKRVTCAFGTCLFPVVSKWNPVLFLLIHLWVDRGASCEPQLACCVREWQSSIKTIISSLYLIYYLTCEKSFNFLCNYMVPCHTSWQGGVGGGKKAYFWSKTWFSYFMAWIAMHLGTSFEAHFLLFSQNFSKST